MSIFEKGVHKSKLLDYNKIHLFGIQLVFAEFHDYYNIIEQGLANEAGVLFKKFEKNRTDLNESTAEVGYANYLDTQLAETYMSYNHYFPHYFRASFLIQLFSFIEYELKEICNHHHHLNATYIGLSDLKGQSDLDKAKIYLSKVCNVDFNDLKPEWDYINLIRKLRNKLVHHNGIIGVDDNDRTLLLSFIKKENSIGFKETPNRMRKSVFEGELSIIITSKDLNQKVIDIAETFFIKLFDQKEGNITV